MNIGKSIQLLLISAALAACATGTKQRPQPLQAPSAEESLSIGDSSITVSYPGAPNGKTTIAFEEDVEINGVRLSPGAYGFYVHEVNDDDWQFVFNSDAAGDARDYDKDDDVLRLAARPRDARPADLSKLDVENIEIGEESAEADLVYRRGAKKSALRIRMTGERRGKGLNPAMPAEARPAWAIVRASLQSLVAENYLQHTRDFAEDFETDFGDGGGTAAHMQLLENLGRFGLLEGTALNFEDLKVEIEGNTATFSSAIVYSPMGTINLTYVLEKREDAWRVTYLGTE